MLQRMRRALVLLVMSACSGPSLDERTCPFKLHPSQVKGTTYRCGYVAREDDVRIAVVAFIGGKDATPVFELSGGPSQSWGNLGLEGIEKGAIVGRDVVFVEQRGTGLSEPSLGCDDDDTFADCVRALRAAEVDIAGVNTVNMADDVEAVRQALAYDKITLYGTSYGTQWARAVLSRHGEHVQAAVLDSVLPSSFAWLSRLGSGTDEAFTALFTACAADALCSMLAPNLEETFIDTVQALAESPFTDANGEVLFDEKAFVLATRDVLSSQPEVAPELILAVAEAARSGAFPSVMQPEETPRPIVAEAVGQYYSVFCADNRGVTANDIAADVARMRPALQPLLKRLMTDLKEACDHWPYDKDVRFDAPDYAGPVLLLAGALDPRTPPSWARDTVRSFKGGTLAVLPNVGHNVRGSSDCANSIIRSFLRGTASPDVSCVSSERPAFFQPQRDARRFTYRRRYTPLDIAR